MSDTLFNKLPLEIINPMFKNILETSQEDIQHYNDTMGYITATDYIIKDLMEYNNLPDVDKPNYNFRTEMARDMIEIDDYDPFNDRMTKDEAIAYARQTGLNKKTIERTKAVQQLMTKYRDEIIPKSDTHFKKLPPKISEKILETQLRDVQLYTKTMKYITDTDHIIKDMMEYNNLPDVDKPNYNFKTPFARDMLEIDDYLDPFKMNMNKDEAVAYIRQRGLNKKIIERTKAVIRLIRMNQYEIYR